MRGEERTNPAGRLGSHFKLQDFESEKDFWRGFKTTSFDYRWFKHNYLIIYRYAREPIGSKYNYLTIYVWLKGRFRSMWLFAAAAGFAPNGTVVAHGDSLTAGGMGSIPFPEQLQWRRGGSESTDSKFSETTDERRTSEPLSLWANLSP